MFCNESLGFLLFHSFLNPRISPSHQCGVSLQCGINQILQLIHVINTFINKVQIFQIIQRLCQIRVATQFYLLNYINVLLFTWHIFQFLSSIFIFFHFIYFLYLFLKYTILYSSKEVIFILSIWLYDLAKNYIIQYWKYWTFFIT